MEFPLDRDVTNPLESAGLYCTLRDILSISIGGVAMAIARTTTQTLSIEPVRKGVLHGTSP
ncbi:MAG: hypothetical protein AABY61_08485 [Nitrospirota bacterium]